MDTPYLQGKSFPEKFLIFLGITLISMALFALASVLIIPSLFGIPLLGISNLETSLDNPITLRALEFLQITQALGLFILPAFIYSFLESKSWFSFTKLNTKPNWTVLFLVSILILCAQPMINILVEWNSSLKLPESFSGIEQWMKETEEKAAKLTEAFLAMNSVSDFIVVFVMVAVLPALGEELLFRGVLQQMIAGAAKNIHTGIWISAILFSALHMQFYGFIPRMLLGATFGYLFYWSGSLWVPVLGHFANNGMAVAFTFLQDLHFLPFDPDTFGTGSEKWILIPASIVFVSLILFTVHKKFVLTAREVPLN